jgi:hypothetical protein
MLLHGITIEQIFSYENGSLGYKQETISYLRLVVGQLETPKTDVDSTLSAFSLSARAERRCPKSIILLKAVQEVKGSS